VVPLRRYTILLERYTGETEDDYGNMVNSWATAAEEKIYGVNLPESTEEGNRLIVERVMLVPPSFKCGDRDRVQLSDEPDVKYEVVGIPQNANQRVLSWNPGGYVTIRRVDG
jgi:hypothetical protein